MADFVRFTMDDGTDVFFESAESDLVDMHGGEPDVADGGRLRDRLDAVAKAAQQVAEPLRERLRPHEVALEFGLKVSGDVNWWFFARNHAEGAIKVTLKWAGAPPSELATEP